MAESVIKSPSVIEDITNQFSIGNGLNSGTLTGNVLKCGKLISGTLSISSPNFKNWYGDLIASTINIKTLTITINAQKSDQTCIPIIGQLNNKTRIYFVNNSQSIPSFTNLLISFCGLLE